MPRFASDVQGLHQVGEAVHPTSAATPRDATASEHLLSALLQISPSDSHSEAINRLLHSFSIAIPGVVFGVVLPANELHPDILLTCPPTEKASRDPAAPNAPLFPKYAHERKAPLALCPEPASLHCASDDANLELPSSNLSRALDTCARVLTIALRSVDAHHTVRKRDQEIERLQSLLVQSDKLSSLGEISAGLVHELSNPLTSIVAYTDYLRQKSERRGDDPEDVDRLRRVGEAADFILTFTRSIVSYARPDDDVPAPVSVAQVIDQALVFCKHIVDVSNVRVRMKLDPSLPHVRSIRGQLTQVIVNLVTNACHAMAREGGTLTLVSSSTSERGTVDIRVEDTGPGIDPEHVERVFDPFFTTKADGVGTGLGLNIVRQIVTRCGGNVRLENTPGKGTTFVVTLPVYELDAR